MCMRQTAVAQRHPAIRAVAYAVEAAAALAAVALASSGPGGWAVAAFAWWAAGMIVLAFVDLAALRPPYRLTVITSAGLLPVLAATGDTSVLLRAVTAAAVLAVFFAVLAVASCGQLGWGDVAIAVPLAAALGWHSWTAFAPESCSASAPTPSPCAGPAASPPGAQLPSVPSSSPPLSSSRCGLGSRRCGHDRQAKPVHEEPS